MLIGLGPALRKIADGQILIVDADRSKLQSAPTLDAIAQAGSQVAGERCAPSGAACRGLC